MPEYRILATVAVEPMDELGEPVAESRWRALDGRSFTGPGESFLDEVSFADEVVEGERRPLLSGGFLRLHCNPNQHAPLAVIEFHSPRRLTEEECGDLVMELEVTLWDGLGDHLRWEHGLEWLAFGEVQLRQESIGGD